jgi:hypothetical protein
MARKWMTVKEIKGEFGLGQNPLRKLVKLGCLDRKDEKKVKGEKGRPRKLYNRYQLRDYGNMSRKERLEYLKEMRASQTNNKVFTDKYVEEAMKTYKVFPPTTVKPTRYYKAKKQESDHSKVETVNHPPHYNKGKIEVITAIEDWGLGFCAGNVVKYIARAEHKDDSKEDLKKALWYIQRMLANL